MVASRLNQALHAPRSHVDTARALYEDLCKDYARHCDLAAAALTQDRELILERCRQIHQDVQVALKQYCDELHRFTGLMACHQTADMSETGER
jgi:hypothetical protein